MRTRYNLAIYTYIFLPDKILSKILTRPIYIFTKSKTKLMIFQRMFLTQQNKQHCRSLLISYYTRITCDVQILALIRRT